jgi:hypothetical protein
LKVPHLTLAHEINPEGEECSCQEAPKPSEHFKSEPTFGQQPSGLHSIGTGSLPPTSTRFRPLQSDHTLKSLA